MARYIDADALIAFANLHKGHKVDSNDIARFPTIEARPVVRGEWEARTDVVGFVRCSVCHDCNIYDDWADGEKWNFCPNCGADMRGTEDDARSESR